MASSFKPGDVVGRQCAGGLSAGGTALPGGWFSIRAECNACASYGAGNEFALTPRAQRRHMFNAYAFAHQWQREHAGPGCGWLAAALDGWQRLLARDLS